MCGICGNERHDSHQRFPDKGKFCSKCENKHGQIKCTHRTSRPNKIKPSSKGEKIKAPPSVREEMLAIWPWTHPDQEECFGLERADRLRMLLKTSGLFEGLAAQCQRNTSVWFHSGSRDKACHWVVTEPCTFFSPAGHCLTLTGTYNENLTFPLTLTLSPRVFSVFFFFFR